MMVYLSPAFRITSTHPQLMASGILGVHVKVFAESTTVSKLDTEIAGEQRQTVVSMVQTMMRMFRRKHVLAVVLTNAEL